MDSMLSFTNINLWWWRWMMTWTQWQHQKHIWGISMTSRWSWVWFTSSHYWRESICSSNVHMDKTHQVESSCWGNILGAFGLVKGSLLFLEIHYKDWLGEDPCPSQWKETWSFNLSFQNYYVKQPFVALEPPTNV